MYNDAEWNGKLILGTDNVLEQYQNSMYAFFQGSGEIYVGGIVWSNDARWIVSHYPLISIDLSIFYNASNILL